MTILNKEEAIEEMQLDRIPSVKSLLGGNIPSARALWRSLVVAETEVARKLGVMLEPTEVFPMVEPTAAELAALGDKPYIVEPGYDMEGGMLGTFQWTSVQLRNRPVIALHSVKFVYPTITTPIYEVPLDWVYPDTKSGLLQFSPRPTASGIAPSLMGASIMARGGAVPQMVRVRYTAGLDPKHRFMPEIIDLIMRTATVKQIKLTPQSASISADGLTQSKSMDVDKIAAAIDHELEGLRQRLLGPVWMVL